MNSRGGKENKEKNKRGTRKGMRWKKEREEEVRKNGGEAMKKDSKKKRRTRKGQR